MQTTLNTKKASVNDIQATVSKIQNLWGEEKCLG
jgi:hypothetical protein